MRRPLLSLLVVLAVLVITDRVAERFAESALAGELQSNADLPERPRVDVRGLPFLTQALSGRYSRVDVDIDAATAAAPVGALRVEQLHAELTGVRVPFADAVRRSVDAVPVDWVRAGGLVPYATLVQAAGRPDLQLRADGERLSVHDAVTVLGRRLEVTALSRVTLTRSEVVITAESFLLDGRPLDPILSQALGDGLDLSVPVQDLPYGLRLTRLRVAERGLLVGAQGPLTLDGDRVR